MRLNINFSLMLTLLTFTACSTNVSVGSGGCSTDSRVICDGAGIGYRCEGSGFPANTGEVCDTNGAGAWCCYASTCAPDSSITTCVANTYGYSCGSGETPPDVTDPSLICSVPLVERGTDKYCCATSGPVTSSTCAPDSSIAGCVAGSYGFACRGTDRPDTDYSGITCSQSATEGIDASGQSALLYCCVYNGSGGGPGSVIDPGTGNGSGGTGGGTSTTTCNASYQIPQSGEVCGVGCDACLQTYECGAQFRACDATCQGQVQSMMDCTKSAAEANGGNLTPDAESTCSSSTLGGVNSAAYSLWWEVIRVSLYCSIPCCSVF